MNMKEEELLVKVMDLFAIRFDKNAVLRGGMALRLLGCERFTNDLDYVFVPYRSKKQIVRDIVAALREIEGADVKYSMNSKCLRVILTVGGTSIQIEAKVAMEAAAEILSTGELARKFNLQPRLIRVSSYSAALANKMAAWNERRLARDVYDIWFYLKMGVRPDIGILRKRLSKCSYSKTVSRENRFSGTGIEEFYGFMSSEVAKLGQKEIADALGDYLKQEEIAGLSMKFRAELMKLR